MNLCALINESKERDTVYFMKVELCTSIDTSSFVCDTVCTVKQIAKSVK